MRKAFGAAAILSACLLGALLTLDREKRRIRRLQALRAGLLALRRALADRLQPLEEIFRSLSQKCGDPQTEELFQKLRDSFSALGELEFSRIWREAVTDCFHRDDPEISEILIPLGECLGGSELERQCTEIDRVAAELERSIEMRKEALPEKRRLTLGYLLSFGAFVVIVLI